MDPFIMLLAVPLALGIYLLASSRSDSRWQIARRYAGIFLIAFPIGGLAYLFAGIEIARARGVGHFFSVPFGGYVVTDSALALSLGCWVGIMFVLIALAFRKKLKRSA
jgi:multisubunit Na+/H+ antiporter MnhB subunit